MSRELVPITTADVEARMIQIRGQYVLLDRKVIIFHCNALSLKNWSKISTGSKP